MRKSAFEFTPKERGLENPATALQALTEVQPNCESRDSCEVGSLSALVPVLHANLLPDEFSLEVFGQGDHQVAHVWVVGFYVDLEIVFP